jgi:hypothetical protein
MTVGEGAGSEDGVDGSGIGNNEDDATDEAERELADESRSWLYVYPRRIEWPLDDSLRCNATCNEDSGRACALGGGCE